MSENPIPITLLNDFIFCPVSIYFHNLDYESEKMAYQSEFQINGSAAHESTDTGRYSSQKDVLQSTTVYSCQYGLLGKIDLFNAKSGILTERKKKIKTVFDGYVFQLYAQYFALCEEGFSVNKIRLYSVDDNKVYNIPLPEDDLAMKEKFESLIIKIKGFDYTTFIQTNKSKCQNCIYEPLCVYSVN